ncbi:MAG: UDP-N-acetylmuramoyl-tripeptide--D-alanyl-D-alanine ligase [Bacteroidia bacterium]
MSQGFKYTTDSRNIERGAIYFALKGDNFNGNKYAIQAIRDGASYAVIDEEVGHDIKLIKVDNVLRFFQEVANMQRRAFDIPVIAIAGSNGKTTTKNLVNAVLSKKFKTHVTAGNFNNHIGVPMTLLDMPQETEIAIIEIGTNHPGEIRELCKIVEPNFGLITNIGKEHLEGFGSLEAVAKEESELYAYLHTNNGVVFVNADDQWLTRMSKSLENKSNYAKSEFTEVNLVPSISFEYEGVAFNSSLMGDYNLDNIAAAIQIGQHFGVSLQDCAEAIASYTSENNRSQIIVKGESTVWLDAYNANPTSMNKALENFALLQQEKKYAVLGDMFEMGSQSETEHLEVLEFALSLPLEHIFLLGERFKTASAGKNCTAFTDKALLMEALTEHSTPSSAFLIKGSRAMRMEDLLEAFHN